MRLPAALSLVVLVSGLAVWATQRDAFAADREKQDINSIQTRVYKVSDLPVWTAEKHFDPSVLILLIQASVSPSDWKPARGDSRMAPYPQNASLVISTGPENHDKIVELLESMRPKE